MSGCRPTRGLKPTATLTSSLRDEEASHNNPAAERHLTVAVAFSPRTSTDAEPRRVATLEMPYQLTQQPFKRRYATHVWLPTDPWVETHGYPHVVAPRRGGVAQQPCRRAA